MEKKKTYDRNKLQNFVKKKKKQQKKWKRKIYQFLAEFETDFKI